MDDMIERVKKYEEEYWKKVFGLVSLVGPRNLPAEFVMVRRVEVIACVDGVLVVRYPADSSPFGVHAKSETRKMNEVLKAHPLLDPYRHPSPEELSLDVKLDKGMLTILRPSAHAIATYYVPDYLSASVICSGTVLSNPVEQAVTDVITFVLAKGLLGGMRSVDEVREQVIDHLRLLERDYKHVLSRSTREEDLQRYFVLHPFLLAREGRLLPKVKLGSEMVTDFIVENPLAPRYSHLFVELEEPKKRLFREAGTQPTADLVHAMNQTDSWRAWLRDNIAYFRQQHPVYTIPKFLIVIGRNHDLSNQKRRALRDLNAQSPDRDIMTYDDLLDSLSELREKLAQMVSKPAKGK